MTLLEPTAILKIESTSGGENDADDGKVAALAFRNNDARNPNGIPFEASIQSAAEDEGGAVTLTARVKNIPRDVMKYIPADVIVRVEAGYRNSNSIPVSTIFTGLLDDVLPSRSGSDVQWDISATSNQTDALNYYVPLSEEEITVGDLLDKLTAPLGISINHVSEAAFDPAAVYPSYTTEGGVLEEIQRRIIPDLRALTGNPDIIAVPSQTNAFEIDIWDLGATEGVRVLDLDLDSRIVYSSGIGRERGAPTTFKPSTERAEEPEVRAAINQFGSNSRLNVTRVFDSRIHIGLQVQFRGKFEGSGLATIDDVQHDIGGRRWTTQFGAKILEGGD